MVQKIIFAIVFFMAGYCCNAQQLQDAQYYLSHADVSQDAKDYYRQGFVAADAQKAYSVLDSIFTENDSTRPFYVLLAGRMLTEANGELLAELNIVCRYVAELHPGTLVAVLFADAGKVPANYRQLWAQRMAVEIRISCTGDLVKCFKQSRSAALQHCTEDSKGRLEVLYNLIRKDLNLFQ